MPEEINYKDTLNLPQTDFPMRANSTIREPEIQKFWEEKNIYKQLNSYRKNKNIGKFILHDGPPYLSSENIHIGTALNKILKDIVVKYKTLRGYYSPYVPGYDCHGLPIESAVLKIEKTTRDNINPIVLRKKCEEFAYKNKISQEKKFKRLGVLADWENSYLTMQPRCESKQLELFGKMYENGYIYRGKKSVYWCCACQTALAEAEVEYVENYKSTSIYVSFPLVKFTNTSKFLEKYSNLNIVIWTTTPWTLPGNVGICLNADYDYVVVKTIHGYLIVAEGLLENFKKTISDECLIVEKFKGKDLENSIAQHPIYKRESKIVLGSYVTLETGTGCVHTAPGHGAEDYEVGLKYGLEILCPVDSKGYFTSEAGEFKGIYTLKEGNAAVIQKLSELGSLIKVEDYFHSYPHCWRSKTPIIFRATKQWFCSVNKFREKVLSEIDRVNWIPSIGRNRIYSMIESRSDWCISRQRPWGVPIPAFYCNDCEKSTENEVLHLNNEIISKISNLVSLHGANVWWEKSPEELLPENYKCKCGASNFRKEFDTMDVWFDSGSTHMTVVDQNPELSPCPVDMYLEGSDQHRGWFQSSLLTSVAVRNFAPYKSVLTHGFVVDENGRKMSKSLGNVIDPEKVISSMGADILRLWVSSIDYSVDVRIGDNMLKQLSEVYRNIRNTVRFLLGNIFDFNPETDYVEYSNLWNIDKYILHKFELLKNEISLSMDNYQFYKYYQLIQNFCSVDLSSFYFDLNKDRLYTSGKKSLSRRSVQTVLYEMLNSLIPILVPVTPHLAEDIWLFLPPQFKKSFVSPLFLDWSKENKNFYNEDLVDSFTSLMQLKEVIYKAIEIARAEKKIGKSVETLINIEFYDNSNTLIKILNDLLNELPLIFIVSQVKINSQDCNKNYLSSQEGNGYKVSVYNADGEKCPRCWKYSTEIGLNKNHPTICLPCANAVEGSDVGYSKITSG